MNIIERLVSDGYVLSHILYAITHYITYHASENELYRASNNFDKDNKEWVMKCIRFGSELVILGMDLIKYTDFDEESFYTMVVDHCMDTAQHEFVINLGYSKCAEYGIHYEFDKSEDVKSIRYDIPNIYTMGLREKLIESLEDHEMKMTTTDLANYINSEINQFAFITGLEESQKKNLLGGK